MNYAVRFFIDDNDVSFAEHCLKYNSAANMVIPRIGEHVWLPDIEPKEHDAWEEFGIRYCVTGIEYSMFESESTGFIEVRVTRDDGDDE